MNENTFLYRKIEMKMQLKKKTSKVFFGCYILGTQASVLSPKWPGYVTKDNKNFFSLYLVIKLYVHFLNPESTN